MMSRSSKGEKLEQELKQEENKEKRKHKLKVIFKIVLIIFIIFLILALYMHFIGTKGLKVREYKIESENLPESFHGFKIVQF